MVKWAKIGKVYITAWDGKETNNSTLESKYKGRRNNNNANTKIDTTNNKWAKTIEENRYKRQSRVEEGNYWLTLFLE